jgi:Flp pilus assembly protein TadD
LTRAEIPFRLLIRTPENSGGETIADAAALSTFRRAAERHPDDPDYRYILGEALVRKGHTEEAVGALCEAVRLHPDQPDYRSALGEAFWVLGRYDEAAGAFRAAIGQRPEDLRARSGLCASLTRLRRLPEAVQVCNEALRRNQRQPEIYNNLGVALWALGRPREALRSFERSLECEPSSADVHFNRALACVALGRVDEGRKGILRAAELHPEDPEIHSRLGEVSWTLGRHDDAVAAFKESVRLDPRCLDSSPEGQTAYDAARLAQLKAQTPSKASAPLVEQVGHVAFRGLVVLMQDVVLGFGRVPRLASLVVVLALAYATIALLPAYLANFRLRDEIVDVARAPIYTDDVELRERLMRAVKRRKLERYIHDGNLRIENNSHWHTITCEYDVPFEPLPGLRRSLHFKIEVEEPVLTGPTH